MLPELDGLTLLSAVRKKNISTPVIMATAMDSLQDKKADWTAEQMNYITKPFDTQELLARIRALTRRPAKLKTSPLLFCGDLSFDPEKLGTICTRKNPFSLSKRRSGLMEYLLKNKGTAPAPRPDRSSVCMGR